MKNTSAEDAMSENSSFKALSMDHCTLFAYAGYDNPCLNDKGTDYFFEMASIVDHPQLFKRQQNGYLRNHL